VAAGRHAVLNWGGIESFGDLARTILRLDYGTGQLVPTREYQGGTGLDRIADFVKNSNLVLIALATAGAIAAFRRVPWYLRTATLAFLVSGPAFIAYANANPAVDTARFILVRFYLLPQVVVAPLAALGLVLAADFARRRLDDPPPWLKHATVSAAAVIAVAELGLAYGAIDRSGDHVARYFAEDILAAVDPQTIILASGDHVVLPLIYLTAVEGQRPDVTVISFQLLGFDWYQREVRRLHPDINLPLARYNEPDGLLTFVRANPQRKIVLTGEEPDQSLAGQYGIIPHGLALPIVEVNRSFDLVPLVEENSRLIATYRVPSLGTIDRNSFERFIVTWYALVPYRIGADYEQAKQYADARVWYGRALAIDPELNDAIVALRRIQTK
jgi:hypothetical protein